MNFLAHLYLSGTRPKVMVGNFVGDFVKGRDFLTRYESDIVMGIELHRSIDHFTDTHKIVQQSKKRISGKYRHYSGVIVDVFYDHFLASTWSTWHSMPLAEFAQYAYEHLRKAEAILPEEVSHMLPYMIKGNWLVGYSKVEGVHRALSGMASRTPYESKMEQASVDLQEHYELFAADFAAFFPQLKEFAEEYLRSRTASDH
jgi:acyl carrier protein phosphodiesterase